MTVLGLVALWFRQMREAELANGEAAELIGLPDKSKLFEALQRLPISFGMAMRVRGVFVSMLLPLVLVVVSYFCSCLAVVAVCVSQYPRYGQDRAGCSPPAM